MKSIVQLELTSYCNRSCSYCGQTKMTRPRGFMSRRVFDRCIEVLKKLGQDTVGINHYGESMLHSEFIRWIALLNDAGITPWVFTNGDLLDSVTIEDLSKLRLGHITISGHMAEGDRRFLAERCSDAGIRAFWQMTLTDENTLDLAGQVAENKYLPLIMPQESCAFIKHEKAIVLWDGRLVPCCFDFDAAMPFGSIMNENVLDLKPSVGKLCENCSGHPANVLG